MARLLGTFPSSAERLENIKQLKRTIAELEKGISKPEKYTKAQIKAAYDKLARRYHDVSLEYISLHENH